MTDLLILPGAAKQKEDCSYDWNRVIEVVAKEKGCIILRPAENELFLDFDTEEQWKGLEEQLADLINDRECPHSISETFSKSGAPNRHVIITFHGKKFSPGERVLFQMLLGSDPKREFLDGRRLFHGVSAENTTCFFEPIAPNEPTN